MSKVLKFMERDYQQSKKGFKKWYPWMRGEFKQAASLAAESVNNAGFMCLPFCSSTSLHKKICGVKTTSGVAVVTKSMPFLYGTMIGDKNGKTLCDVVDDSDFLSVCMRRCRRNTFAAIDFTLLLATRKIKGLGGETEAEEDDDDESHEDDEEGWGVGDASEPTTQYNQEYDPEELKAAFMDVTHSTNGSETVPRWAALTFGGTAVVTLAMGFAMLRMKRPFGQTAGVASPGSVELLE